MSMAAPPPLGEPRVLHYCYVCNTALNSCKQAMVHCSGKRHKKKLLFVQTRRPDLCPPPPSVPPVNHYNPSQPPPVHAFAQCASMAAMPPPYPQLVSTPAVTNAPPPPFMTGGAQPPPSSYYQQRPPSLWPPGQQPPPMPQLHHHLPPPPVAHVGHMHGEAVYSYLPSPNMYALPPHVHTPYDGTSNSSYSGGLRSAVISPSETSSMSSDPSQPSRRHSRLIYVTSALATNNTANAESLYECAVCFVRFATGALLHQHLHSAQHYKPHNHRFLMSIASGTSLDTPPAKSTASSSADTSGGGGSGDTSLFYCSVCSIAVNSHAQLHAHNSGHRHRGRVTHGGQAAAAHDGQQPGTSDALRSFSRSSSSPDTLPMEHVTHESGYTSGSGDDRHCIKMIDDTQQYHCRVCNIVLSNQAQVKAVSGCASVPLTLQHMATERHSQRKQPVSRRTSKTNSSLRNRV